MSELARVVAAVFRQKGRDTMPRNEFKQLLSFRLNWYPPQQASQLLERAMAAGLVEEDGEAVRVTFDVLALELPLDFRGSLRALDEPLRRSPAAAAPRAEDPAVDERARVLRERAGGRLSPGAARLLALREAGQDVREAAAKELASMMRAPARMP